MVPLYGEHTSYESGPRLPTPEEPILPPVDSPLETRQTADKTMAMADQGQEKPSRAKSTSSTKQTPARKKSESSSTFRFMVVEHPDQLKDKAQMRKNRIHVMHDYLNKESQNPDSKDTRVQGHNKSHGKRKQSRRETPPASTTQSTTLNACAPSNIFRSDMARLTPAESVHSSTSSRDTPDRENHQASSKSVRLSGPMLGANTDPAASRWLPGSAADKRGPLVQGIGGYFENSRYMRAAIQDVPFSNKYNHPPASFAGSLEPFGTWPSFTDPSLDVNELKWECSRRFGSKSISVHWIPTILRARHAFLSTLCISSAHDDIMARAQLPPHSQNGPTLQKRFKVRTGVIQMINDSLSDPEMRIADETIIAILHVLNSEIMGCNDQAMRVHQDGLHAMVRERGGLDKLGAGGQLAAILTITNYMIAGLRESTPHRDFIEFASKMMTQLPHDAQKLPESPIYSRPEGYHNLKTVLREDGDTFQLLETLRRLTHRFYIENSQQSSTIPSTLRSTKLWNSSDETVSSLYSKIFAVQPAAELDFPNGAHDRKMFEAIRLASLIYAHAMANKIPFSKAASQVRSTSMTDNGREENKSMTIQIRDVLKDTDLSYCWDHLAGVLFWITLIAGAGANPGPMDNEDRVGDEEDARKWLAAIAVRCCIVLSFEHGHSVLETLKRLVAIETALGQTDSLDDSLTAVSLSAQWTPTYPSGSGKVVFGPERPPVVQRGFADFAEDFMSI